MSKNEREFISLFLFLPNSKIFSNNIYLVFFIFYEGKEKGKSARTMNIATKCKRYSLIRSDTFRENRKCKGKKKNKNTIVRIL